MECENNVRHNKRDKSMPGQEALQQTGDHKGPAQGSFIILSSPTSQRYKHLMEHLQRIVSNLNHTKHKYVPLPMIRTTDMCDRHPPLPSC